MPVALTSPDFGSADADASAPPTPPVGVNCTRVGVAVAGLFVDTGVGVCVELGVGEVVVERLVGRADGVADRVVGFGEVVTRRVGVAVAGPFVGVGCP